MKLDPDTLADLRRQATHMRASWIASVTSGLVDVDDVVQAACDRHNKPLRRIRLQVLLEAQPGWTHARAVRVCRRLRVATRTPASTPKHLTVSWLLDTRARSNRRDAWQVCRRELDVPAPGWPFVALGG